MKTKSAWLLATWFGCGYVPKAPGTAGALGAIVIAIPLWRFAGFSGWEFGALSLLALYPAIRVADIVSRESGLKDPQIVVVDEVLGTWLTLAGAARITWVSLGLAFLLFRIFDIWKPPPVRQTERLPGGAGIVLDDMVAGLYGALVLFAMGWFNFY
jgi:phosphatidylglycerophosphatase A